MHHVVNGRPLYQMVREHRRRSDYLDLLHGLFGKHKRESHAAESESSESSSEEEESSKKSQKKLDVPATSSLENAVMLLSQRLAGTDDDKPASPAEPIEILDTEAEPEDDTDNTYTRWGLYMATIMIFFVCFGHDLFHGGHHHHGHHHGHITGIHH